MAKYSKCGKPIYSSNYYCSDVSWKQNRINDLGYSNNVRDLAIRSQALLYDISYKRVQLND